MKQYIVTLSDAEDKALGYVANQKEWIDNVVHERCRIAMDEIIQQEVRRRLDLGEVISGTKDDIVLSAPIKTAEERTAESLNSRI